MLTENIDRKVVNWLYSHYPTPLPRFYCNHLTYFVMGGSRLPGAGQANRQDGSRGGYYRLHWSQIKL